MTGKDDFVLASRITLLPLVLHQLTRNRLNFVSFTPGTSLDLKSAGRDRPGARASPSTAARDAGAPRPCGRLGARRVFQGGVASDANFRWYLRDVDAEPARRKASFGSSRRLSSARSSRAETRESRASASSSRISGSASVGSGSTGRRAIWTIGGASSAPCAISSRSVCVSALEPDLVILDEFQRFKHLLRTDEPAGELAQQLFAFRDHRGEPARVLLLSATPYKMYTVSEDVDDDHYADLSTPSVSSSTTRPRPQRSSATSSAYREALFHLDPADLRRALVTEGVARAEAAPSDGENRTAVDHAGSKRDARRATPRRACGSRSADSRASLQSTGLPARSMRATSSSTGSRAPYLLTFMDDYKLVRTLERASERDEADDAFRSSFVISVFFAGKRSRAIGKIDPENPRLRSLISEVLDAEAWQLLWTPTLAPVLRAQPRLSTRNDCEASRSGWSSLRGPSHPRPSPLSSAMRPSGACSGKRANELPKPRRA